MSSGLRLGSPLELSTNLREDFMITDKDPTRAFSWFKAPTSTFTFKNLLIYAKHRALGLRKEKFGVSKRRVSRIVISTMTVPC